MFKIPSFFNRTDKRAIIEEKPVEIPSLEKILTIDNEVYFSLVAVEECHLNSIDSIDQLKEFLAVFCYKIILIESLINKLVCDIASDRYEPPSADQTNKELSRKLELGEELRFRVQSDEIANCRCPRSLEAIAHELIKYWVTKALILKNLCKGR